MKLGKTEYVVTAYAEPAGGPGWSNRLLWVVIRDSATGVIRRDCLQPDEQTEEMWTLYNISADVHRKMVRAVESKVTRTKRKAVG